MIKTSSKSHVVTKPHNRNMAVNCTGVKRLGEHMPKLTKEPVSDLHEEISITRTTKLHIVFGFLCIESTYCSSDTVIMKWISLPADFLYTELQNALHPGEEVPLNVNDPDYPVGSMYTSFHCRIVGHTSMFSEKVSEDLSSPTDYHATSKLFFGYHKTKRGSYYCLKNHSFAKDETGNGVTIRIDRYQMERILKFLRRHLYKYSNADTNSGR